MNKYTMIEQINRPQIQRIDELMNKLLVKKTFKGLKNVKKQEKVCMDSICDILSSLTHFVSHIDVKAQDFVSKLVQDCILEDFFVNKLFGYWSTFRQIAKQQINFFNDFIISQQRATGDSAIKIIEMISDKIEVYKIYQEYYQNVCKLVNFSSQLNITAIQKGQKDHKKIQQLYSLIFIPLQVLASVKYKFEKYCMMLISMKHQYQKEAKEVLINFNEILTAITIEVSRYKWQEPTLKSIQQIIPTQMASIKQRGLTPLYTQFTAIVNQSKCKIYILDDIILIHKSDWKNYTKIPIFIQLDRHSFIKTYAHEPGIFTKNMVIVCGNNACYHLAIPDRIMLHNFYELVKFRIACFSALNFNEEICNPYYEQLEDPIYIRIEAKQRMIRFKDQIWYRIKIIVPITDALLSLFSVKDKREDFFYEILTVRESEILELKAYLQKIKPDLHDYLDQLLLITLNLGGESDKLNEYECLRITEFLNSLFHLAIFRKNFCTICLKLGLSEGLWSLLRKIQNPKQITEFCRCFDCKYQIEDQSYFQDIAIARQKYQNNVQEHSLRHYLLQKTSIRDYCPIYLLKIEESYKKYLQDCFSNVKGGKNEIQQSDFHSLKEEISMIKYRSKKCEFNLFPTLSKKAQIPKLMVRVYRVTQTNQNIKVIGLCRDSTVRHVKIMLAKILGLQDIFLGSYVLAISEKMRIENEQQQSTPKYETLLDDGEYILKLIPAINSKNYILSLRKWIKIPCQKLNLSISERDLKMNEIELQIEAGQMLFEINQNWLKIRPNRQSKFFAQYFSIIFILHRYDFVNSQIKTQFKFEDLKQIPTINQSLIMKYLSSYESQQYYGSIEQKRKNKEKHLQFYINDRMIDTRQKLANVSELAKKKYRLNLFKEMIDVVDENTDWNVEIFFGFMFENQVNEPNAKVKQHERTKRQVCLRVNYYALMVYICKQNQKDQVITQVDYQKLKVWVSASILFLRSIQIGTLAIYFKQPHLVSDLIKFYKQMKKQRDTLVLGNNKSLMHALQNGQSISSSFQVLEQTSLIILQNQPQILNNLNKQQQKTIVYHQKDQKTQKQQILMNI